MTLDIDLNTPLNDLNTFNHLSNEPLNIDLNISLNELNTSNHLSNVPLNIDLNIPLNDLSTSNHLSNVPLEISLNIPCSVLNTSNLNATYSSNDLFDYLSDEEEDIGFESEDSVSEDEEDVAELFYNNIEEDIGTWSFFFSFCECLFILVLHLSLLYCATFCTQYSPRFI